MNNLLTLKQVAQRLQVSLQTVRRLVWSGKLPTAKIGRQLRVSEADLQAFIAQRKEED